MKFTNAMWVKFTSYRTPTPPAILWQVKVSSKPIRSCSVTSWSKTSSMMMQWDCYQQDLWIYPITTKNQQHFINGERGELHFRGYNPSYPIIRPFIRVITPFITSRGPSCIAITYNPTYRGYITQFKTGRSAHLVPLAHVFLTTSPTSRPSSRWPIPAVGKIATFHAKENWSPMLLFPITSMGLVYLPTFTIKINQM